MNRLAEMQHRVNPLRSQQEKSAQILTDDYEHDEQFRQAQNFEAMGQLAGGIAHEFNNLLMVIVGNLELTKQMLFDDEIARDQILKFSNTSMDSAMRGADLIGKILAISCKQNLKIECVELNLLTARMLESLQRTLGETTQININLSQDLWSITADAAQIEVVLLNLSLNARDAMPRGGQITITTSNAPLNGELISKRPKTPPRDYVMLELTDKGDGMTQDIVAQAFDPFFTTKDVGKGIGLGLSLVHGFIEQIGGFINIESEPGIGTTVRIYFPRAETNIVN